MTGDVPTIPQSHTGSLSPTGERLLRIAEVVTQSGAATGDPPPALSEFVQTYREWIATSRGKSESQLAQAERWQMIMYTMVTATNLEEAIDRLIRFGKVLWGARSPSALRREGDQAVLVFNEPFQAGAEGLIAAVWILSLTLCELEFLSNARFDSVSGRVTNDACLPDDITRLLFAPPIVFGIDEVALVFPARYLYRPVTARACDLPDFFRQLLPLTLGVGRTRPSIRSMAAGLIRDDKLSADYREPTLINVAARLGMSSATLRRRLQDEGTTYRAVKDAVYDDLSQGWLRQGDVAIDEIARRLGFSDGFSFRRFFRRLNGQSPSAFVAAHQHLAPTLDVECHSLLVQ